VATVLSVAKTPARDPEAVRCFKCTRERQRGDLGWHFLDPSKLPGTMRQGIVHVCPVHYQQFAAAERGRWEPLFEGEIIDPLRRPSSLTVAS